MRAMARPRRSWSSAFSTTSGGGHPRHVFTDSAARRLSLRQRWRFFFNRLERWLLLRLHQLDVEAQGLQLADEDVERFRQPGLERGVALDDRFVDLRAPGHIVGLRGEEFLKNVRRAVRFERPDFHLSEPLTTELRLTTQRLLRDE